jgi:hypothetical protein
MRPFPEAVKVLSSVLFKAARIAYSWIKETEEIMNGIRKVCWVATIALMLAVLGSGCDSDDVAEYCGQYAYCYDNWNYDDCVETMHYQEESALNVGELCHAAFLDYMSCVGNLDCIRLLEYDSDGSHCGGAFSTYQDTCLGLPY